MHFLNTYDVNFIGVSLVDEDNNHNYSEIVSTSSKFIVTPEKFHVLTPTKKYQNSLTTSSSQLIFPSPSSIASSSSKTRKWVQELCKMPSPTIKKKNQQSREKLIEICKRQKKN